MALPNIAKYFNEQVCTQSQLCLALLGFLSLYKNISNVDGEALNTLVVAAES